VFTLAGAVVRVKAQLTGLNQSTSATLTPSMSAIDRVGEQFKTLEHPLPRGGGLMPPNPVKIKVSPL